MTRRRFRMGALLGLAALCLALPRPVASQPSRSGWHYEVSFDAALATIRVKQCFSGAVPRRLVSNHPEALAALRPVAGLGRTGREVIPRDLSPGACVVYDVDVATLLRTGDTNENTHRVGRDLVTRPGLVLLMPADWPEDAHVTARFAGPPGYGVCVAWPRGADGSFVLPRGALTTMTRLALGRFEPFTARVLETEMTFYVLDRPLRLTSSELAQWIEDCGRPVSDLYRGFPVDRLQVLVQPQPRDHGRPVQFARALRGGGALVHLMVSPQRTAAAFRGDWITVHELIHLGMPWNTPAGRWWGEGFVDYYQDTLRARAGFATSMEAWQRLHDWMERGKRSGGRFPLLEESRRMSTGYAYHRVYYGGAALALKMDLEIRRRWPGQRSFDDVMRFLHRTYAGGTTPYDGLELLAAVDQWLGAPICVPIARRHLGSTTFPDLTVAYRDLGLVVTPQGLRARDDAPMARARSAITRR